MDLGLKQRVAMVSGGSAGLGYAVAEALAREGAYVSIASRSPERIGAAALRLREAFGTEVIGVDADLTDEAALARWHARTIATFGRLDMLFVNAGGPPPGTALGFDLKAWRAATALTLESAVELARLAVPSMRASGGGSILMNGSLAVKQPVPELALSSVLRPSVAALAKTLSIELAPSIRVNSILPGRIATARTAEIDRFAAAQAGVERSEIEARAIAAVPLGRSGTPAEFGRIAAFLLSDAASFVTGVAVAVDGGATRGW